MLTQLHTEETADKEVTTSTIPFINLSSTSRQEMRHASAVRFTEPTLAMAP